MIDLRELKRHEGHVLQLRFKDGHAVRARLVDVDPHAAPPEVIYDVLEVLDRGPLDPGSIHVHAAQASAAADLESWVPTH